MIIGIIELRYCNNLWIYVHEYAFQNVFIYTSATFCAWSLDFCARRSALRIRPCSTHPFATQGCRNGSFFCSVFFCIKWDNHNVRKVTEPDFWEKMPVGQGTQKVSKMTEKQGVWSFDNYLNHLCVLFYMEH